MIQLVKNIMNKFFLKTLFDFFHGNMHVCILKHMTKKYTHFFYKPNSYGQFIDKKQSANLHPFLIQMFLIIKKGNTIHVVCTFDVKKRCAWR